MNNDKSIKDSVRSKYAEIAVKNTGCGCGCGDNSKVIDYSIMQDDYTKLDGYVDTADLGLGCGVPTEYAGIKKGDIVVDLGSGAGNDIFVARPFTGEEGKLIGIDFTQEMIDKANANKFLTGYENVEFKLGEIENIPLAESEADVVISNCVLNLVPDKQRAFAEIFRILKPGGHFCVSDIVIKGDLHPKLKESAEMYAGCVAGAIQKDDYLGIIRENGFENIKIKRTKVIELPDEILKEYLDEDEIKDFKSRDIGIFSITVVGHKP
ncbi:MAG: arsenite methyltransferase [Melioribacteraceae bacterium]|nr:arsenite methyltransferase [Melioribacteraceae bacterium]MCO6474299.1 arsenite methyltransferase [Melioribacteraceae bacterium]MDD3557224.1 arsenite methyltransferase [Melioribacteraceae bacterium]